MRLQWGRIARSREAAIFFHTNELCGSCPYSGRATVMEEEGETRWAQQSHEMSGDIGLCVSSMATHRVQGGPGRSR